MPHVQIIQLFLQEKFLILTDLQLYMNQSRGEDSEGPSLFIQEETIEEQLLLKTSQLHQSLRNRRMLHFEYLQASLMKENILKKCEQIQIINQNLEQKEIQTEEDIQQINRQTQLYLERISRQKQAKAIRQKQIESLNGNNRQLKLQLKKKIVFVNQLIGNEKENQSFVINNQFISLQKLNLEANNLSKEQMLNTLKQDVITAQHKLKQKQQIRNQLKGQYEQLLKEVQIEQKKAGLSQCEFQKSREKYQMTERDIYQIREPVKKQRKNNKDRQSARAHHTKQNKCRPKTGQSIIKAKIL